MSKSVSRLLKLLVFAGIFLLLGGYVAYKKVYPKVKHALFVHDVKSAPGLARKRYDAVVPLLQVSNPIALPQIVPGTLTFNKDIAPIVFQKCALCHQPNQAAPFSLLTYHDVQKRARTIAKVTAARVMPPWKPRAGVGEYLDDTSLSDQQIAMIQQWVSEGSVEGAPEDLPPPPPVRHDWELGPPDAILKLPEYAVGPEGDDIYRAFVIPTNFPEDRYIRAIDIRPSNRRIVHHCAVFTDTTGAGRKLDEAEPGPGYTIFGSLKFSPTGALGVWAPGMTPRPLRDGTGYFLPKGADIVVQAHFTRSGKPEVDQTDLGIYFCDKPVDKQVRALTVAVAPRYVQIPAGDSHYLLSGARKVPGAITVEQIFPHMHLLGQEIIASATFPDGRQQALMHITDWDFNWQAFYRLKNPVHLPAGSTLSGVFSCDNSTGNPRNPNQPPKFTQFGESTKNEMVALFVLYTVDSEFITKGQRAQGYPDSLLEFGHRQAR